MLTLPSLCISESTKYMQIQSLASFSSLYVNAPRESHFRMKLLALQEKKKEILKDMRNNYKHLPRTVEVKEQCRDASNLKEITDEISNLKLHLETK